VRARDAPLLLAMVWESIQAAYAKLQTTEKLSNLVLSMFRSVSNPWSTPPDLKAHAPEIRHLVPALALVAKQRVDASSTSGHCAAALEYLARFYLECEGQGIFMSRESAEAAEKNMRKSLQRYAWLHVHFCDSARFPVRPKTHWCYHIGQFSKCQNPRAQWTYKNEDWVGRIALMAHSCSHGTRSIMVAQSLHAKYRVMLHMRLLNDLAAH